MSAMSVVLREATAEDVDSVVHLVGAMLRDMASYGGRALDAEHQVESELRAHLTSGLGDRDHVVLLAALEGNEKAPVGVIEASVRSPHSVFRSRRVLHIHSIYVEPGYRREGIGRTLLDAALEWGREAGCIEAELNVLVNNPARRLYVRTGFEVLEVKMGREL